jgi:hypothetical protein
VEERDFILSKSKCGNSYVYPRSYIHVMRPRLQKSGYFPPQRITDVGRPGPYFGACSAISNCMDP